MNRELLNRKVDQVNAVLAGMEQTEVVSVIFEILKEAAILIADYRAKAGFQSGGPKDELRFLLNELMTKGVDQWSGR